MSIRAMVMAAGAGTRLHPLTHSIPKPMVPVANRPVLEYTLENLRRHGITRVMMNLHSHPRMIQDYFKDGARWGLRIEYSHEPHLLGTAGGVKNVEGFLQGGTFIVMSGDGLTTINLTNLIAFHKRKKAFATMGLTPVNTRFEYGITLTKPGGRVTRFIEKPLWSDVFSNQVNTGIYVLEPRTLASIPARKSFDFGHQLWPLLLKKQKAIFGYPMKEYWCDVGNLKDYRRAHHDVLDGKVGIALPGKEVRPGIWIEEGTRLGPGVKLHAPCLIGRDGLIGRGASIGAYTVIGHRARVGAGSVVQNSILWDDVRVGPKVKLENCILGHGTRVAESIFIFEGSVITISH